MKIQLEPWAITPERAHDTDAGLDLMTPVDITIESWDRSAIVDTGVHVQLPPNTCGILVSKSGLNVKHGITSTGLIDEGYTGTIKVKLYKHDSRYMFIKKGSKISQLVVVPCLYEPVEIVDQIDGWDRGDQGFGSTGR